MYYLFIDTTNNFCYLALFCDKKFLNSINVKINKNVVDIIVGCIDKLFKKCKISFNQLTHIYLNIGPGSFTGVKVGVVITKAIKLIHTNIIVKTINSLLLQTNEKHCISVIDAKSNKFYLAVYDNWKTIIRPCLVDLNELKKITKKFKNFNLIVNQIDKMYDNVILHWENFKVIKNIDKLQPLYLKNPV